MKPADPKNYLWETICTLMKVKDATVDAVQLRTKVGRGTIQRIKEGKTSIRSDSLLSIAEAFGIEVWELLRPLPNKSDAATLPMSLTAAVQAISAAVEAIPPTHHDWRADAFTSFAHEPSNWMRLAEKLTLLGVDMGQPAQPQPTAAPVEISVQAPDEQPVATSRFGLYFAKGFAALGESKNAEHVFHTTHDAFQMALAEHGFLQWPHHDRREDQRFISHDRRTPPPATPKQKKVLPQAPS